MPRNLYLVAYDVCDPKRLSRVGRYFHSYRVAGQKSVPEIWVTPAELQRVPRRICVVSGLAKASPVLGALRAGVATDLVIDQETARAVLARMKPGIRLG